MYLKTKGLFCHTMSDAVFYLQTIIAMPVVLLAKWEIFSQTISNRSINYISFAHVKKFNMCEHTHMVAKDKDHTHAKVFREPYTSKCNFFGIWTKLKSIERYFMRINNPNNAFNFQKMKKIKKRFFVVFFFWNFRHNNFLRSVMSITLEHTWGKKCNKKSIRALRVVLCAVFIASMGILFEWEYIRIVQTMSSEYWVQFQKLSI